MKIIRLGTITKDTATGLVGMLTHAHFGPAGALRSYGFQPKGLHPKNKVPVPSKWLNPSRIPAADAKDLVDVKLPFNVLGTEVQDLASGYKGKAVGVILYTNGCVHFEVQAPGKVSETNEPIEVCEFDIRRLKGIAITPLSQEQKDKSERVNPSPCAMPAGNRC